MQNKMRIFERYIQTEMTLVVHALFPFLSSAHKRAPLKKQQHLLN